MRSNKDPVIKNSIIFIDKNTHHNVDNIIIIINNVYLK